MTATAQKLNKEGVWVVDEIEAQPWGNNSSFFLYLELTWRGMMLVEMGGVAPPSLLPLSLSSSEPQGGMVVGSQVDLK